MIPEGSRDTADFSFDHRNIFRKYYYIIIIIHNLFIFYNLGEQKIKMTDSKFLYRLRTWSNARGTKIWEMKYIIIHICH